MSILLGALFVSCKNIYSKESSSKSVDLEKIKCDNYLIEQKYYTNSTLVTQAPI